MSTAWVVEQLNVVEYLSPGLTPFFVDLAFNALRLQQLEEAFSPSVVMAVTSVTHAQLKIIYQISINKLYASFKH